MRNRVIAIASAAAAVLAGCGARPQPAARRPLESLLVSTATMLAVRDLRRSVGFYRDSLGFDVRMNQPGIALLARGDMLLYLVRESPPTRDKPGVTLAPPPEPDHTPVSLVFRVRDARSACVELERRGVLFLAEPGRPPWGGLRCFARDPDGYLIELEQPAP